MQTVCAMTTSTVPPHVHAYVVSQFCAGSFALHLHAHISSRTLISYLSLNHHLYADYTQLFLSFRPPDLDSSATVTHLQHTRCQVCELYSGVHHWCCFRSCLLKLKKIDFAFIHSQLAYDIEIYGKSYPTRLNKLAVLSNKIPRILQCAARDDLYTNFNTLSFSGVGTGGSGGSMNRGPRAPVATEKF